MSETTLSAEVEAALEWIEAYFDPANPNGVYRDKRNFEHLATLRTALERAARIEAAARAVLGDHDERMECFPGMNSQPHRLTVMRDLRAALNEEGA
jgi:hypothetical protein